MSTATENRIENNQLQTAQPKREIRAVEDKGPFAVLLDSARFDHLWRVAQMFSTSDMVPTQFRGKPANCFIALQMAFRMGVDPMMMLQSCYVVHGRPGIESKLAIALANASGKFRGPIRYSLNGEGKTRECTAWAIDRETGDEVRQTVTRSMAEAEGWTTDKKTKEGATIKSKWNTLGDLMLQYRAAMFLIRLNCPEVLMGMTSKEELDDTGREDVIEAQSRPRSLTDLTARLEESFATVSPEAVRQGEADAVHEFAKQVTDEAEGPLAALPAQLDQCTTLGAVQQCEASWIFPDHTWSGAEVASIKEQCEAKRTEIRGKRGERSNQQAGLPLGEGNAP